MEMKECDVGAHIILFVISTIYLTFTRRIQAANMCCIILLNSCSDINILAHRDKFYIILILDSIPLIIFLRETFLAGND